MSLKAAHQSRIKSTPALGVDFFVCYLASRMSTTGDCNR